MSMHAVESLDEALERAKSLMFPIRRGLWLKVALIVLLGTGMGGDNIGRAGDLFQKSELSPEAVWVIIAAVVAFIIAALALWYVSAVMRFVLVRTLIEKEANIKADLKSQAEAGLGLFLLELAFIAALMGLVIVGFVAAVAILGAPEPGVASIILIIAIVAAGALVLVAWTVLMWLLSEFAVPIAYTQGIGIVPAYARSLRLAAANMWEFTVFSVISVLLGVAAAIPIFILTVLLMLPLIAVFFVIAVASGAVSETGAGPFDGLSISAGMACIIAAAAVALWLIIVGLSYVVCLLSLPISVFFRYYSLGFLSRLDPSLGVFKAAEPKMTQVASAEAAKVKVY